MVGRRFWFGMRRVGCYREVGGRREGDWILWECEITNDGSVNCDR